MVNSTTLSQVTSGLNKLIASEAKQHKIINQNQKGIVVGEFTIVPNEHTYDLLKNGRWFINFENKIIAFEYARNFPRTKLKSTYLKDIDKSLTRAKSKAIYHVHNIKLSRKKKDMDSTILHQNLLTECKFKINQYISSAAKFSKYNF